MFWTVTLSLLSGMGQLLKLFFLTLLFSLPLGLLIASAQPVQAGELAVQRDRVDHSRHAPDAAIDHHFLWPRQVVR